MNACATALPETVSTRTVPAAAHAPAGAVPPLAAPAPPTRADVRRQAARVVATTRRHWFDDAP